jgi:hypothetical protein
MEQLEEPKRDLLDLRFKRSATKDGHDGESFEVKFALRNRPRDWYVYKRNELG